MIQKLHEIAILPELLQEKGRTFELIWITDLFYLPGRCSISLLFRDVENKGYRYKLDSIPPELLSYCTVGSFFKEGKKLHRLKPKGEEISFKINSTSINQIVPIVRAITDSEYNLDFLAEQQNSSYHHNITAYCKHQNCLVFRDDFTKVVIPCSVIAGTYYFRSTSMREQVLCQNLKGLYEWCYIDPDTHHAEILMKPGASDNDASHIARFANNGFAFNRCEMIMNHIRATGNRPPIPIKTDFPVKQELTITARGHLADNPEGGKTFIVFEILKENSEFPFKSITIVRRRYDPSTGRDMMVLSALDSDSSDRMVNTPPAAREIRKIIEKHVRFSNPNEEAMPTAKEYIEPNPNKKGEYRLVSKEAMEEANLSAQRRKNVEQKTAKAQITHRQNREPCNSGYEMSLDEFILMVSMLKEREGVTEWSYSEQPVWKKSTKKEMRHRSLKETYDGEEATRRRCAYFSFHYFAKRVCLVEIDQRQLPSGCSTFVLFSTKHEAVKEADNVVKWFVEGLAQEKMRAQLVKEGVTFKVKHHPPSNSKTDASNWVSRLIKIIT